MKKTVLSFKKSILTLMTCAAICGCDVQEKQAKYIFVMIGDGMGASHVAMTESYLSYKAGKIGGEQLTFTKFPILGMSTTYSADRHITCSSASGTAIATGHKTNNDMLGVTPEGESLKSMAYALKEQGYNIGIASSVPVNHATPAAFYANSSSRHDYYDIALQIPESGFNFFAGSGFIDRNGRNNDKEPLEEVLKKAGYDVCYGVSELNGSEDKDGVVLLAPSQKNEVLNYDVEYAEQDDSPEEVMHAAIDFLGERKPFFIMYEGGEIDWSEHGNDVKGTVESILRFDGAIKIAYDFYLKHPDETLIIVTADHETGGISLGAGHGLDINWEKFDSIPANETYDVKNNRISSSELNIGWTSDNHTGGPVPVYAIGKGAERFSGRMDNTDFYRKIVLK